MELVGMHILMLQELEKAQMSPRGQNYIFLSCLHVYMHNEDQSDALDCVDFCFVYMTSQ